MQYEITFIVKDEKDVEIVKDILEKKKAKVLHELEMGRKNFAYPIKKETAGFYWTYYFEAKSNILKDINQELQTNNDVLRFLITNFKLDISEIKKMSKESRKKTVRMPKKEVKEEIQSDIKKVEKKDKEVEEKVEEKTATKTKKETKKKTTTKKAKSTAKTKKTTKKTAEKKENKSDDQERIQKLEEKLDELLKD